MFVKVATAFCILLVVSLANATPITRNSKTLFDLNKEAENACSIDKSLFEDQLRMQMMMRSTPNKVLCPLNCLLTSTHIVNDGGLNKIIVEWGREFLQFVLDHADQLHQYSQLAPLQSQIDSKGKSAFEPFFHLMRRMEGQVKEACAKTNDAARDSAIMSMINSLQFQIPNLPDEGDFVPSDDSSPMLEIMHEAEVQCFPQHNVTIFSVILDLKEERKTTPNVCSITCFYSKIDFIEGNSLSSDYLEEYRKKASNKGKQAEFDDILKTVSEELPVINSKCSSNENEIVENEVSDARFGEAYDKLAAAYMKLAEFNKA